MRQYQVILHCEPGESGEARFKYFPDADTSAGALKETAEWVIKKELDVITVEVVPLN